MIRHTWRFIAVSALIAGMPAGGCASQRALTDADRAGLRSQPTIRVVHYTTPVPSVEAPKARVATRASIAPHDLPTGGEIQGELGDYDPTLDLARRFSGMLSRSAGLKNLRLERETSPLPPFNDTKKLQVRYKNGAVLEVWTEHWGFRPVPMDWKNHTLTFNAKARLTRVQDGHVLWSSGCSYASTGKNFSERVVLNELKSSNDRKPLARFRQTISQAADKCAQQLLRDYSRTD